MGSRPLPVRRDGLTSWLKSHEEQARSMKLGFMLGLGMLALLAGIVGVLKLMGI
jgi:hypothetical protein